MTGDPFHGLSTPRIELRKLTPTDAQAFCAYRSDPAVARYQSWSDYDLDKAKALIEGQQPLVFGQPGAWCQIGLFDRDGILLGDCAFHILNDDPRQAELGFTLATAHQQQGYAHEACTALLHYAYSELDLHRVHAVVDVLNTPAHRLLERLGFRREGHFVENIWFKGHWGSEYLYAILQQEWAR